MATLILSPFTINAYDITPHGYGQGTIVDSYNVPTGAKEFNSNYAEYGSETDSIDFRPRL